MSTPTNRRFSSALILAQITRIVREDLSEKEVLAAIDNVDEQLNVFVDLIATAVAQKLSRKMSSLRFDMVSGEREARDYVVKKRGENDFHTEGEVE